MKVSNNPVEGMTEGIGDIHDCFWEIDRVEKEKKNAERRVPEKQDWHDIFDTITDMITIHDNDFNIIHANKAARMILGLPFPIYKAKCYEYYHGNSAPPAGCPSCKCLVTGETSTFEMYEPHLSMHMEIRVIPRLDDKDRVIGLIHIVRDITARKAVEEELNVHRNHLEWLVRERTAELTAMNEWLQREIGERRKTRKEKERLMKEIQEALLNITTLSGLLTICAWCKKVRDERGYWKQADSRQDENYYGRVTHGICPDCAVKLKEEIEAS